MTGKDPVLSAEVVLKPKSGQSAQTAVITAETIKSFAPSAEAVREVQQYFADRGFKVGGLSGISITISAPRSVFERMFGASIQQGRSQSAAVKGKAKAANELPLKRLPASLARHVDAVTFSPPMDFGPTGGFRAN